jgi:splicing factor U2AF subunit
MTDVACEGLHGLEMGQSTLVMQRASAIAPSLQGPLPTVPPITPIEIIGAHNLRNFKPTPVLLLLNAVLPEELETDADYDEIFDDVQAEVSKFGKIVKFLLPRPMEGAEIPGIGKVPSLLNSKLLQIYVQYAHEEDAFEAQRALAGRKYGERTVLATFYDVEKFKRGDIE